MGKVGRGFTPVDATGVGAFGRSEWALRDLLDLRPVHALPPRIHPAAAARSSMLTLALASFTLTASTPETAADTTNPAATDTHAECDAGSHTETDLGADADAGIAKVATESSGFRPDPTT